MAVLNLRRFSKTESGILSHLFDEKESVICVTLEHAYLSAGAGWLPKVPEGAFTCVRGTHQLSDGVPFETFEVTGVPGHSGILFHCGNWEAQSSGCLLVGTAVSGDMITESRKAFQKFMDLMDGVDSFTLNVS